MFFVGRAVRRREPEGFARAGFACDAPPTRRRQGAMAVGALRLPPCPQRLPLLFPKISLRCDFWEPCFIACGVSADTRWGHERKKCADVGSRERSEAPPTRRRQGAMAVGALRLPPCPQRLPLLFPKISLRCDFWEPCFIACGVSATGGVKSDEISGKKPVFFCWSRRQARRTCLAIAARIPKRTSVL